MFLFGQMKTETRGLEAFVRFTDLFEIPAQLHSDNAKSFLATEILLSEVFMLDDFGRQFKSADMKPVINPFFGMLIIGPMFSGKTTELMRLLKRYQIAKYRCMVIKYYKDTRYNSDCIISHDKQHLEAVNASKLNLFLDTANNYDVIGIDEGQFFPDIVSFTNEMAEKGKIVLVAALDATFERKAFGEILQLIPSCESVVKLTAVCMNCNKDASFTKRIGIEKEVEIIGGADKYLSVCRKCYSLDLWPSSSPLKENSKENQMISPPPRQQQPKPIKKSPLNLINSQTSSVTENDFSNEDFQPPPLVNIKSNHTRGKLFSSP